MDMCHEGDHEAKQRRKYLSHLRCYSGWWFVDRNVCGQRRLNFTVKLLKMRATFLRTCPIKSVDVFNSIVWNL